MVHSRTFSSEIELQEKVHFPQVQFHAGTRPKAHGNPPAPVPAGAKPAQIDWRNRTRGFLLVCFPSSNKTTHNLL